MSLHINNLFAEGLNTVQCSGNRLVLFFLLGHQVSHVVYIMIIIPSFLLFSLYGNLDTSPALFIYTGLVSLSDQDFPWGVVGNSRLL